MRALSWGMSKKDQKPDPEGPQGHQVFLDLLGNENGVFDVGDFLAWVEGTGQTQALMAPPRAAPLLRRKP